MSQPRPSVAAPAAYVFPTPERSTLANGVQVRRFDLPGQYVVSVRVFVPLSPAAEPRELEGIATIMARLLDEGTEQHGSQEFAELLERHGIALGAGMSDRGLSVDLEVPQRHLPAALDLLRQALEEPVFPEAEVARMVRSRLAQIEQERALPAHRAAREFLTVFYDPHERASRPTAGRAETVSAITPQDVRDFHARHVGPAGATVVVAGDFGDLDLTRLLGETLGAWRGGPTTARPAGGQPAREASDRRRIVIVDRPGSVQTELQVGCPGPARSVPTGWAPYPVLGYVLGGSPTARIDLVLREEKGYTYGIRSGFRPRAAGGLFLTSGSVRSDATVESLGLVLDILDGGREGFTPEELRAGVDYLTRTAASRYTTADQVADEAISHAMDGLPDDVLTTDLAEMNYLTPTALRDAYCAYIQGDWTVVLVADASVHAEGVRRLGRGEVTVVPA